MLLWDQIFFWGGAKVSKGDKLLQQKHPLPPGRKPDCAANVKGFETLLVENCRKKLSETFRTLNEGDLRDKNAETLVIDFWEILENC